MMFIPISFIALYHKKLLYCNNVMGLNMNVTVCQIQPEP